jgi:cysteinyl-tRNA synthetase
VRSFAGYGKLSGQRIEELEEGARVEGEPGKEDPLDFAIWKAAKPGEPAWESPWGMGRPGWHIECSAMGLRYLGAGFDVHGGGRDLIFPHHENEIAQSEAAGLSFARVWMHNGMIRSGGEKMAKSVGNIFLLREVLDRYAPAVLLTYFLTTHYRSPLEFSVEKLDEAKAAYDRLVEAVRTAHFRIDHPGEGDPLPAAELRAAAEATRSSFADSMDDDLNTAAALGELFSLSRELFRYVGAADAARAAVDADVLEEIEDTIVDSLEALHIGVPDAVGAGRAGGRTADSEAGGADEGGAGAAGGRRAVDGGGAGQPGEEQACATENVTLPSAARLALEGRWADLELLSGERLACGDATYACALRDHYRAEKDWASADRVRDEIQEAGFELRDTTQGTQVVHRD